MRTTASPEPDLVDPDRFMSLVATRKVLLMDGSSDCWVAERLMSSLKTCTVLIGGWSVGRDYFQNQKNRSEFATPPKSNTRITCPALIAA